MTLHTPGYAWPYPELTDIPDGATQVGNLATAADATVSALASTVTANAARSALLATLLGTAIEAYNAQAGTLTNTTSTAYSNALVAGAGAFTTFVAPPSGIVGIDYGADGRSSAASISAVFSPQVRVGTSASTGTIVLTAQDPVSTATNSQTNNQTCTGFHELTGLIPGTTYNVVLQWRVSNTGTASGANPRVRITPRLA